MNRIILIGNGFDLAHGIKTSYNDFIDHFWEKTVEELKIAIRSNVTTYLGPFENEEILIDPLPGVLLMGNWLIGNSYEDLARCLEKVSSGFVIKNKFLEIITDKKRNATWVDIELEYYHLLKDSFKKKNSSYSIDELNKDFARIKVLLSEYLTEVEAKFTQEFKNKELINEIGHKIYSVLQYKDFTEESISKITEKEFERIKNEVNTNTESANQYLVSIIRNLEPEKEIRKLLISDGAVNYFDLYPDEILFLNFNYTFTEELYNSHNHFLIFECKKEIYKKSIHIHGSINPTDKNEIIFGFGDEIDEDYKAIENLYNNEYLENIKSIKYLENDNYKQLLEFLNGDQYQIFLFGHSCGISDRTLLSTLFEHENCVSIKPFYYLKEDGSDNYSDIVRNITRNFNSKSVLRDKVVNKKYCEPLHQKNK